MTIKNIFTILFILLSFAAMAQKTPVAKSAITSQTEVVTDTFTVSGNCKMCKARIEGAMDLKGVKSATWSPTTKMATVSYDPAKVSEAEIKKAVAEVGHDVPGYRGSDKAYNRLHECCKHRTGE